METYKRINEDYLDNCDIQLDDINVMTDVREELDEWSHNVYMGLSFNPQMLPDSFYKVHTLKELENIIKRTMSECGYECSLNWIDVTQVKNMNWLFSESKFNGDISRWDVSHVEDMQAMFYNSAFDGSNGSIVDWDVSNVTNMHAIFTKCTFCQDISNWNCENVRFLDQAFNGTNIPNKFKPKAYQELLKKK